MKKKSKTEAPKPKGRGHKVVVGSTSATRIGSARTKPQSNR